MKDDGAAKVAPDLAAAAVVVVEQPIVSEHYPNRPAPLCLSPPRPLHVLRCLWLC